MDAIRRMSALLLFALPILAQAPQASPSWETATSLPGIDFSGLSAARKTAALNIMRDTGCTCGCGMKVAQCRVVDPPCTYSQGIANLILKGVREGKTPDEVVKMVENSPIGRPRAPQKVLEDPVQIGITGAPSLGKDTAPIVLVEFSDFECPYCAKAANDIHEIMAAYPNEIRLVYKQFPLSMHPHANMAALASLAAKQQGKFWEMYDKMFANYRQLSLEHVLAWAGQLGMNVDKFKADMELPANKAIVQKDIQDGEFVGVNGTPSVFINGKHFNGPVQLAAMKPYLDEELKTSRPASRP